jgi:hypothetical protein
MQLTVIRPRTSNLASVKMSRARTPDAVDPSRNGLSAST